MQGGVRFLMEKLQMLNIYFSFFQDFLEFNSLYYRVAIVVSFNFNSLPFSIK